MRVESRYEMPGKIRKSGPSRSRRGRLIQSFPLVCLPQGGYCGQWSHLVFSVGLAAKLKASAAPLVMFVPAIVSQNAGHKIPYKISLRTSGAISRPDGTAHLLVEAKPQALRARLLSLGPSGTICANKIYRSALSTSGEGST
jgi:hypothetical protein